MNDDERSFLNGQKEVYRKAFNRLKTEHGKLLSDIYKNVGSLNIINGENKSPSKNRIRKTIQDIQEYELSIKALPFDEYVVINDIFSKFPEKNQLIAMVTRHKRENQDRSRKHMKLLPLITFISKSDGTIKHVNGNLASLSRLYENYEDSMKLLRENLAYYYKTHKDDYYVYKIDLISKVWKKNNRLNLYTSTDEIIQYMIDYGKL